MAARNLFKELDALNATLPSSVEVEHDEIFGVGLRLYELRKKNAYDLPDGHKECCIREGQDGKVHVRGETESLEGSKVRVSPIVTRPCWTFDELHRELRAGLGQRAIGTSTVHDQSSRTHAILELEVINRPLLAAREAVVERQSELVPVGKVATGIYIGEIASGYIRLPDGKYVVDSEKPPDQARIDAAETRKKEFEERLELAEAHVQDVVESCQRSRLGGKFVFVDLAGSEYFREGGDSSVQAKQTAQERLESHQINIDLFALGGSYPGSCFKRRSGSIPCFAIDHGTARAICWSYRQLIFNDTDCLSILGSICGIS